MCDRCYGKGLIYKDLGFGVSIEKCPNCKTDYDPCAELRKRIEQYKIEQGIA